MNIKRVGLITLSGVAGLGAFALVASRPATVRDLGQVPVAGPAQPASAVVVPAPRSLVDILVAAKALSPGDRVGAADLRWAGFIAESIPAGAIKKAETPKAIDELVGAFVRQPLAEGEIVTQRRVIKAGESGYLTTILPKGSRAVAIPLDTRGGRSAGGFIFPHDRVDVILSSIEQVRGRGGAPSPNARTILEDIKVLAIGQQMSDPNSKGQRTLVGETATLEVTPEQAEMLAAALKTTGGEVSLALRPMGEKDVPVERVNANTKMTIVRFGVAK